MIRSRNAIAAMNPWRWEDSYTEIFLKVWFEELNGPVEFMATPFDTERHGKELWIRAMAGEYGPIEVRTEQPVLQIEPPRRMISYDR